MTRNARSSFGRNERDSPKERDYVCQIGKKRFGYSLFHPDFSDLVGKLDTVRRLWSYLIRHHIKPPTGEPDDVATGSG
jgi:hypothetical protein